MMCLAVSSQYRCRLDTGIPLSGLPQILLCILGDSEASSSRRSAPSADTGSAAGDVAAPSPVSIPRHKESFRQYRHNNSGAFESEMEETSESGGSADESISTSDTGSSSESDDDNERGERAGAHACVRFSSL